MMIATSTLKFLSELSRHNNKEWFDEHRAEYNAAKANFTDFVTGLAIKISEIDESLPFYPGNIKIFRINRDVRFSKDKTPYKQNFGAYIGKGGLMGEQGGYYLHLEPGDKSGIAGGIYMPQPKRLTMLRNLVSENYPEMMDLLSDRKFHQAFPDGFMTDQALKRVPRDFPVDHPAAELLKLKSYAVWSNVTDAEVTSVNFAGKVIDVYRQVHLLLKILNK